MVELNPHNPTVDLETRAVVVVVVVQVLSAMRLKRRVRAAWGGGGA